MIAKYNVADITYLKDEYNSKLESIINRISTHNRQKKIDFILDDTPFKEEKIENDIEYIDLIFNTENPCKNVFIIDHISLIK